MRHTKGRNGKNGLQSMYAYYPAAITHDEWYGYEFWYMEEYFYLEQSWKGRLLGLCDNGSI